MSIKIVAKKNLQRHEPVGLFEAGADITGISFKDDIADLNPSKGDQIVWLFRDRWHFGLYFDFSRQRKTLRDDV